MLHLLLFIFWSHFSEEPLFGAALYHSAHRRACLLAGRDDFLPHDLERGTSGLKRPLTLFRPGFFRPSGTGGVQKPPPCNFKTAYAMATKFAQDSVRANSNSYRYCDVTVT